jgi:hypothetical protein
MFEVSLMRYPACYVFWGKDSVNLARVGRMLSCGGSTSGEYY